jgi:chemotaxis protein MotB
LLFPSGSSSATNSASDIIEVIYNVIGDVSNFVRVRGYTDNEVIKTEFFSSNWELSVFRATSILHVLETLGMNPARMAIEGYGQYYPTADNRTAEGRARNRKVVVAISKYGLDRANLINTPTISLKDIEPVSEVSKKETGEVKIIRLPNGGIRITAGNESDNTSEVNKQQNDDNN